MEIETFIHGACVSHIQDSAIEQHDRRKERQPRVLRPALQEKYRAGEVEGYLLSPKDLNMSEHIPN